MNGNLFLLSVCMPILIISACGRSGKSYSEVYPEVAAMAVDSMELALPEVPADLKEPGERAAFVSLHFWDALDFGRDSRSLDTGFVEQNFANYLTVLAVTPEEDAQKAVARLLSEAGKSEGASGLLRYVAEHYLDDPNSPMRSEELYIYFLREWISASESEEGVRLRAEHRLGEAMKNRRGEIATDFRLVRRDGAESTLLKELGAGETLVMFYDPDCEQCKEIKGELAVAPLPEGVKVIAIDVTGDRKRFEATKRDMPESWTVGFDLEGVEDKERYVFRAMPTFYVLASDGRVLLKDPPVETIIGHR